MAIKKTIFNSKYEEQLYKSIESNWNSEFRIIPQLPPQQIFDLESLNITSDEKDFLYKSSIDFTVCDLLNKPIMSLEFDGICRGISRMGEFVDGKETDDTTRKKKLDLKLRIAREENYPFYVVSYMEKNFISNKSYLSVIDGIIGQTIAHSKLDINELMEHFQSDIDALENDEDKHEFIQDVILNAEIENEMTWDPIVKRSSHIRNVLREHNVYANGQKYEYFSEPTRTEIFGGKGKQGNQDLSEDYKKIKWFGCRMTIDYVKNSVTKSVKIRNFEGSHASPLIIAQNIAELSALEEIAKRFNIVT